MAKFLRIIEWDQFQHYKDRNPQWIKLHTSTLTSPIWYKADDSQKVLIVVVMLMAARHGNSIPADPAFIQQIGNLRTRPNLNWLIKQGFCEYSDIEERRESPWPTRYIPDDVRAAVLTRDGSKCVKCGKTEKLEIDHIIPVSKGGKGVLENLQTLCVSCNRSKRNRVASSNEQRSELLRSPAQERSLEKRREENIDREETEVIKPPPEIGIDHATTKVFLEVGLAGNEARMLVHDAVNAYFHHNKVSYELAADGLIEIYREYEAKPMQFKKGVFKFFKEGLWKAAQVEEWRNGETRKPAEQRQRQPSAQVERFNNNLAEVEREYGSSAVAAAASANGTRQTSRLSSGDTPALEGEIKRLHR